MSGCRAASVVGGVPPSWRDNWGVASREPVGDGVVGPIAYGGEYLVHAFFRHSAGFGDLFKKQNHLVAHLLLVLAAEQDSE